jgi:hypothetical protein
LKIYLINILHIQSSANQQQKQSNIAAQHAGLMNQMASPLGGGSIPLPPGGGGGMGK